MKTKLLMASAVLIGGMASANAQYASDRTGAVMSYTPPAATSADVPDVANAKPMPLPRATFQSSVGPRAVPLPHGAPGMSPGGNGTGEKSQISLPPSSALSPEVVPEDAGPTCGIKCQWPFTTNRADPFGLAVTNFYPFRAAGQLFFKIGASTFVCSASLIKPGLLVTAAHCVANFGHSQFYSGWTYYPARSGGTLPFGAWTAARVAVLSSYFNGTDSCAQSGVICQDDVAVILLRPHVNVLGQLVVPGSFTGWLGYGWNGYGFFNGLTEITQLGYPCNLNGCTLMERSDSQGFVDGEFSNNIIIGSEQEGGSSGGPWAINFGRSPTGLQASDLLRDIVVGVTSWGFVNSSIMELGASPFTSGNIVPLVNFFCPHAPQC